MTTFQDFPPSLLTLSPRVTRTGDPSASIAGVNTTTVADGAWCYCIENKKEYQLDRADNTTPPDGDEVIAPLAGPGRWFRRDFGATSTTGTIAVVQATDATNFFDVAPPYPGNQYIAAQGTAFALPINIGAFFALDPGGGGKIVYTGPDVDVLCTVAASIADRVIGSSERVFGFGISFNGDIIGDATFGPTLTARGCQFFSFAGGQDPGGTTCLRVVSLQSGDTLQPVLSKLLVDSTQDEVLHGYTMTVQILQPTPSP